MGAVSISGGVAVAGGLVAAATGGGGVEGGGNGANDVYQSRDPKTKDVQYVGITNDLARRAAEHLRSKGIRIEKILGDLARSDARAVEQALIEIHGLGKNGGSLLNKINSISNANPEYADLLRRGYELLSSIGYK